MPTIKAADAGVLPGSGFENALIDLLKNAKGQIIQFEPGIYHCSRQIPLQYLEDVIFTGQKTIFNKSPGFKGEYLFTFSHCKGLEFSGLHWNGITSEPETYRWGEQALIFMDVDGLSVHNCRFTNIGDAAIRITSPPNSQLMTRNVIIRNNLFDRVTQLTTTQAGGKGAQGGAQNVQILHNVFKGLRGSIKLAARQEGCGGFVIKHNHIQGVPMLSTSHGLEIVSASDIQANKNTFMDQGGAVVTVYVANMAGLSGWEFGNIDISNNFAIDARVGIRVSGGKYANGFVPKMQGIRLKRNEFMGLPEGSKPIMLVNGATAEVS